MNYNFCFMSNRVRSLLQTNRKRKKRNPANTAAKSKVEGGRIYLSFLRAGAGKGVSCGNIFEKIKKTKAVMVILQICFNLETQRANEKEQKDKLMQRRKEANGI